MPDSHVDDRLSSIASRVAGKVTKLVDRDYAAAMHGLDGLIDRLSKAAKTLNPQDESRASLERAVEDFDALRSDLVREFRGLARVDI